MKGSLNTLQRTVAIINTCSRHKKFRLYGAICGKP